MRLLFGMVVPYVFLNGDAGLLPCCDIVVAHGNAPCTTAIAQYKVRRAFLC
jgi:hypothetical protein